MKSIIKFIGVSVLILGGAFIGATTYAKHSNSEFASIIDQLNPLIPAGEVYVKTIKPDSVNGYGTASYTQQAVLASGEQQQVTFNGIEELKVGHYLKLTTKGKHVESYAEVNENEIPTKALEKLNQ